MEIHYDPECVQRLRQWIRRPLSDRAAFEQRTALEKSALSPGFSRLLSLDRTRLSLFPHQNSAIRRVLIEMRGRAILADEAGLGKTIEAGVLLKEYMARQLVRRALVLTPASLVTQWRSELKTKLDITLTAASSPVELSRGRRWIASLDTVKRDPWARAVCAAPWDMVIVDEAHRLKDRSTLNWRFVNAIQTSYLLLLTATPIQNNLRELYNLVTLLRPGQLKTFPEFKRYFMLDKHRPKNIPSLREALREVMVRTRRSEALMTGVRRRIHPIVVNIIGKERHVYDAVLSMARRAWHSQSPDGRSILPFMVLLRQASSHPAGAVQTLRSIVRRGGRHTIDGRDLDRLEHMASRLIPEKLGRLTSLIKDEDQRIIVFTEFRMTKRHIVSHLRQAGLAVHQFHGGMSSEDKTSAIERFRLDGGVLVSTEAGGEGINLQFCRVVVNYDLPWNPMKLEQRVGRVHRLGQEEDVDIFHLVNRGTIESHVLDLLVKKIDMFQKVIGEVDEILTGLDGNLGRRIAVAALMSEDRDELDTRMGELGREIHTLRTSYEAMSRRSAQWLDEEAPVTLSDSS